MPYLTRSMRPRWPPSPCVEDEAASLSRELNGLSYLGEKPGIEGACARGTIDQKPLLLTLVIPSPPSLVHSTGHSSSDGSHGPNTPPSDRPQPSFPLVNDLPHKSSPKPPTTLHQAHPPQDTRKEARTTDGPRKPQLHQPAPNYKVANLPRDNRSSKLVNYPNYSRNATQNAPVLSSRTPSYEEAPSNSAASSSPPERPGSTRCGHFVERAPSVQQSAPVSDLRFDLAAKYKSNQAHPNHGTQKGFKKSAGVLTLAQRIEEKLQHRREQRYSASASPQEGQSNEEIPIVSPVTNHVNVVPHIVTTETPEGSKRSVIRQSASAPQSPNRGSRSRATSTSPKVISAEVSEDDDSDAESFSTAPLPISEPMSSIKAPSRPAPPKRTVSFLDEALQSPAVLNQQIKSKSPRVSPGSSRRSSPSRELTRLSSPGTSGICLFPCPRSVPIVGYQDWFTIRGLEHLNICSSCMRQVSKSKFRDFFMRRNAKSQGQKTRCSFSEPWTRLAWLQTIKQGLDNLDMLYAITRPPSGSGQCPGRITSDQYWHRVVDTETDMYLPNFNACSACARNIKVLMPSLRETFRRRAIMQERICDFVTDSPRFIQYIDLLDIAANRARSRGSQRPNITEFLSYARRKVLLRDCRRNRQVFATWHYMPQLPEFTVCEDCYDDAVWPLAQANKPIARKFSSTMRLLPGNDGPSRCRKASCQLYSPRMRAKFRDAVMKNDFAYLEHIALRRFDAEQIYHERREVLLDNESLGYDCDVGLRRNMEEWKRWE